MGATELAGLNLNHLVALDALLAERNVRLAALRMGVTQSAMSHTLRALRELLGDPLLVRIGNAMVPTEHAEQLAGSLRRGLDELETVVRGRAAFSPGSIRDEFTLATHDGIGTPLVAPLLRALHAHAPHARLKVTPVEAARLHGQLATGEVDAALVPPLLNLGGLHTEPMLPSTLVALVRKGHPRIRKRLTLGAFCDTPHALYTLGSDGPGVIDRLLEPLGRTRHVAVKVPYLFALPELIATTDLIAAVAEPVAQSLCDSRPLRTLPLPFEVPPIPMMLCWHERFEADAAARFFREQVRTAARDLEAQASTAGRRRR